MMRRSIYFLFCYFLIQIQCKNISFINNAILIPIRSKLNSTILTNLTCDDCLCLTAHNSSILALNCYENLSCEFYLRYPRMYKIQSMNNSRLYFLQNIRPQASIPCCMSNTTLLLRKLQNSSNRMISINVNKPRCIVLDESNSLVAVTHTNGVPSYFDRFNPQTLVRLEHIPINASVTTITYYQGRYYIGIDSNETISVFIKDGSTNSLRFITNIKAPTSSAMSGVRDIIFVDNGQTMVVASADNNRLYFFSMRNQTNYQMTRYITVNYGIPHGLFRMNDSFFYVASWTVPSIYAYKYNETTLNWTQTLFATAPPSTHSGSHVLVDDCDRRWFTISGYGIRIYNANGVNIGNWILGSGYFDTLLLDRYVVLLSNPENNKITRIDPQITCDQD
ncbi:hypothetical protein I4U23_004337 [Adineta vaga]|nr:hypothetical protein I4U23_004337 [Adineta vaga]